MVILNLKQMNKVAKNSFLTVMLAVAVTYTGCKKDPVETHGSAMQKVALKGRVTGTNGLPISDVTVSTGSLTATTDAQGEFSFDRASVVKKRAVIKFEKSGYFTLTRSGVKGDEMFIEAVLYPKGNSNISLKTSFDAAQAKTLSVPAGMKVDLTASSIMRADGSAYSGQVNADMLYLDPNNENFTGMMPGGDLAAIRGDNSEVMLVSWGMTDVNFTDNQGNPLQIKSNAPAELTFPIPAGMESNPPATIPLWSFDEKKGIWIEEGVATLQGNVYVGKVTHFSWVNLDEPARRVTIRGKVKDCDDEPVAYVKVTAGQTSAYTNSRGEYSMTVPDNTSVTVSVTANGGTASKNVPGRPGDSTFNVDDLKVPCPEDGPGEGGTLVYTEKGAVKYLIGHESDESDGSYFFYAITFDNNGKRYRSDLFIDDDDDNEEFNRLAWIVNHLTKTYWAYTLFYDEKNPLNSGMKWVDMDYKDAPEDFFLFQISSSEAELLKGGFTKQTNRTIAGKSCSVYSQSMKVQGMSMKYTIALWNGLTMLWEVEYSDGTETSSTFWVAQSVTLDVPEVAFTKTLDLTWLK